MRGNSNTRRPFVSTVWTMASLVLVALLFAACATAQPTPTPVPKSAPAPAAKPTTAAPAASPAAAKPATDKPPLKIGFLMPYTGVYVNMADGGTNGMSLFFEQSGNVAGGRKIEIIKEDTEAKPDVALRKIRKLVEQDKVDLLAGVVASPVALALRDYVDQNKIPLVITNAGANDVVRAKKSRYIVRVSFSNWQWNSAFGPWIYQNLAKEALLTATDNAAGYEQTGGFAETFEKAGGKITDKIWVPMGTNDYGPYVTKIQAANPQLVYAFFPGPDGLNFVKTFQSFGLKGKIKLATSGSTVDDDILQAQGEAAVGILNSHDYAVSYDSPENKKFQADYRGKFNKVPDGYAARGYDGGRVIVEAVNKLQGDTSDKLKLIDAMVGVKFTGPRGPFAIDPETQNVIINGMLREVKMVDGKPDNVVFEVVKAIKDPGK